MKKKGILIIIIILITAIIVTLCGLIIINKKNSNNIANTKENKGDSLQNINKLQDVNSYTKFYTIENCIKKYISYCTLKINDSLAISLNIDSEEQKKQAIINLLNESYIKENNINLNNLYNYVNELDGLYGFINLKTNMILRDSKISEYIVYGKIQDLQRDTYKNIYFDVKTDESNATFMLNQISEDEYKNIEKIELKSVTTQILKNENNSYSMAKTTKYEIALKHIEKYILQAINFPDEAYESLDKEYKEKRFGTLEKFKEYVEKNEKVISSITLEKYNIDETSSEEYKRYVCIDNYGNYYIFKETAPMQYTLVLDTYTLDFDEFVQKYNSVNNQNKVALNLEKIKQALNSKDYNYIYSKLDENFKNNYFKTLREFETYMQNTFFNVNKFDYTDFLNQGSIYMYTTKITDYTGINSSELEKTFIMKLEEGTNFVMSFNID